MILEKQIVMSVMKTQNGLEVTESMILNSIDTFKQVPIVYNKNQNFKDYTGEDFETKYQDNIVIGHICEAPELVGKDVLAKIFLRDDYSHLWKGKYDNWLINLEDDKSGFIVNSIEVF